MVGSQNVLFRLAITEDKFAHPPGEPIAQKLAELLKPRGVSTSEIDNWRDSGWSIEVIYDGASYQIALAEAGDHSLWMAQITPLNQPGTIARLFGAKAIDRSPELFDLASIVHAALTEIGGTNVRWKIDGFPDDTSNTEPVQSKRKEARP
jgi:hypothetical protein